MSLRRRTVEALIAAGLLVTALAPPAAASGAPSQVPLRVATYNIHAGAGMDNVFDLDRLTTQIRALDADVITIETSRSGSAARSPVRCSTSTGACTDLATSVQ